MKVAVTLLLALIVEVFFIALIRRVVYLDGYWLARGGVAFIVFYILVVGVKNSGWSWRTGDWRRVRVKALGVWACWFVLLAYTAFLSSVLNEGQSLDFLQDFLFLLPVFLLLMPFYLYWADGNSDQSEDGYFVLGEVLLRRRRWLWSEQRAFVLGWVVKIFFIPIMYSGLFMSFSFLISYEWKFYPESLVKGIFLFGLTFDLLIATLGYILSSRLMKTEILSTEPTLLGWFVCLICYPPFLSVFKLVREQADNILWYDWLNPEQALYWLWLFLVVFSWAGYWFSNACFGLRFSNLTWRGLVSWGPYAVMKHPSYVFKNFYWWISTVPFIGVEFGLDMLRNFLALTFVSGVYYLRAKTEERHLQAFSEYRAYSEALKVSGLCSRLLNFRKRSLEV